MKTPTTSVSRSSSKTIGPTGVTTAFWLVLDESRNVRCRCCRTDPATLRKRIDYSRKFRRERPISEQRCRVITSFFADYMEMVSFRALPMFLVDSCAPLPCTSKTSGDIEFFSAALCVSLRPLRFKALSMQRSQGYAENRREYGLCKAARLRRLKP